MIALVRMQALAVIIIGVGCFTEPPKETSESNPREAAAAEAQNHRTSDGSPKRTIESAIPPSAGYRRIAVSSSSFGAWLRDLPLRPGRPPVHLYDGRRKGNQAAHHAVLDVDVGDRDLQQCADAVIRLRAEYLFAAGCRDEIQFDFTSGDTARWSEWRDGARPLVSGNDVSWRQSAVADDGYSNFRRYLDTVFMYAGSASLERELRDVANPARPRIGDVFVQGGFPGHAVLVVDVAQNDEGHRAFLLAQSYMPAQDIHVLRSFEAISPWYRARPDGILRTPEWDFSFDDLERFPRSDCEAEALGPRSAPDRMTGEPTARRRSADGQQPGAD